MGLSGLQNLTIARDGRKLGFTNPGDYNLIDTTTKQDYDPPYELSKRFEQLYEL